MTHDIYISQYHPSVLDMLNSFIIIFLEYISSCLSCYTNLIIAIFRMMNATQFSIMLRKFTISYKTRFLVMLFSTIDLTFSLEVNYAM